MTGTTPIDTIIQGDALTRLKELPSESVDCCITSPPYFGLRDYGVEGQIGLEESPEAYVSKLVEVFREVRRVLKKDGTLWLNLGDSYWGGKGQSNYAYQERRTSPSFEGDQHNITGMGQTRPTDGKHSEIKPKDLIGIPWMVAFALRADGWYLRSDIIWHKPNCMPESCKDRPTKAHEYIFLLSKSERYFYDSVAIQEEANYDGRKDTRYKGSQKYANQENPLQSVNSKDVSGNERWPNQINGVPSRNKRTVWTVATKPFAEAHFATFPPALIEPCILAGTSEGGNCPECGKAWERQVETDTFSTRPHSRPVGDCRGKTASQCQSGSPQQSNQCKTSKTIGWLPSCQCGDLKPVPGIILDPFFGAGTTGLVAKKLGRCFIGIELNGAYIGMAQKRIAAVPNRLDNWM